jgi:uridylate kinase
MESEGDSGPHRILLKLSGEALAGDRGSGLDEGTLEFIAGEIGRLRSIGAEVAVVVGGGNFFRGASSRWMDRVSADHIGMLATVMNALALKEALVRASVPSVVLSAFAIPSIVEGFHHVRGRQRMADGQVLILCGGTGNPLFTTDTAAAVRAVELGCGLLIKATRVDGVYDADPRRQPDAQRYDEVSYSAALERGLAVMDAAAFVLCRDHGIPIRVLDLFVTGNLERAATGNAVGTLVH